MLSISILLGLVIFSQCLMWVRVESFSKNNKSSKEIIEKYDGVTTLAKIPEKVSYKDVEPDWKTFYDFMENVKLEGWKAEVTEDSIRTGRDSCWVVNIISHDQKSSMGGRLRDYGDGVFLASCVIRAGGTSLSVSKEDKVASDIILFFWDYIIKYYEERNINDTLYYKQTIEKINSQLKTLNRTQRLNNILTNN